MNYRIIITGIYYLLLLLLFFFFLGGGSYFQEKGGVDYCPEQNFAIQKWGLLGN